MITRRDLATGIAAFAFALSSPAHAQQAGGTIHVAVTPEPPLLMQALNQNGPTNMIAGNIYESLLRFDEKLNPQPSLAKSWEISDDGLVYTFRLQEGVKWHDGASFSADDVVFSLDVFLREVHPRWRPIVNAQVESIAKSDELTVIITLKQPFGPLLLAMETASAPIVPKHIYEGTDFKTNEMNNTPIGTGAFKLEEWNRGSFIHLVKNEDYWMADRPYLNEIFYQFIPDAAARAVAYQTGTIDVLTGGSVDIFDVPRLAALDNSCMTEKGWEMFAPHAWVTINHRNGILGNQKFRQGLMYATDREFGRDVVWNGFGKIPTGPISSKTRFYDGDVTTYGYDPERARQLIAESGYDGTPIKFLALPYGEIWTRWGEALRQNWGDVGVNLEIVTTDVPGWVQKTSEWDFDMTFNFLYQLGDPAIGVARSYISSNIIKGSPFANVGGYSNPASDDLFARAAATSDEAERQTLYSQMQQMLADDLPVLWLLELDYPTIMRCNVKNLPNTAIGVNDGFRDVWME